MAPPTLILGVGNEYRGDDAVGLVVARRIADAQLDDVTTLEHSGEGASLIEAWSGADRVILIDAAQSDTKPGEISRFDANEQPIPTRFFRYSTHAFSVAEAIETARAIGQLPQRLIVYAIEGRAFEMGVKMAPEVSRAAEVVARRIIDELGQEADA
jgi:hydrogenase maturation protease